MKIHKLSYRLVRSLVLFVGVLGAITLFTNTSFTGGQTVVSAAESALSYDSGTKTLTVGPGGELPTDFRNRSNVMSAETIVFTSNETSGKVVAPQDSLNLFYGLDKLKRFKGMQNFDTSNVTTMSYMFYYCTNLTEVDVSGFNTSKVTNMSVMFMYCNSLTKLDVSRFDTSKVTDMYGMFFGCNSLTQLDVSGFNTSQVTDMSVMFMGCNSITELDARGFDTSKVTGDMYGMFSGTTAMWKLTLGPACIIDATTQLPNPVPTTPFQHNFRNDTVSSTKWLNEQTRAEYTADQISTAHLAGTADTYIWQGNDKTTVEYVVQPSYTITIPATITIPSATVAGTGDVTLSAYPKVPYEERFIHISATSGITNQWHLTTTGDATGAEYDFTGEGGVNLKTGAYLVIEADGEASAKTKTVSASLTDNAHKFKYAGAYMDTVTFTIQTAAS
ncbi:MAG: BspA family leucine-rich repeat surface protein [Lactobacillaceae bacterium]|jgi:surface protein|nr:BspA family leucine-rich repeat surface protein [Lactobacillaceae bacterium]